MAHNKPWILLMEVMSFCKKSQSLCIEANCLSVIRMNSIGQNWQIELAHRDSIRIVLVSKRTNGVAKLFATQRERSTRFCDEKCKTTTYAISPFVWSHQRCRDASLSWSILAPYGGINVACAWVQRLPLCWKIILNYNLSQVDLWTHFVLWWHLRRWAVVRFTYIQKRISPQQ